MHVDHPAWEEHQRKRWMRHDAHRWLKPTYEPKAKSALRSLRQPPMSLQQSRKRGASICE